MLLSHRYRFIYTKTLKAAGTSVEIYFEPACLPDNSRLVSSHHIGETVTPAGVIGYRGPNPAGCTWYNHMPASEIRALIGDQVWHSYYKFCVVRNPFDKLVSFWWFVVNRTHDSLYRRADFSVIRSAFSQWCRHHASEAVDRDKYLIDGQPVMDHFVRYESLVEGIQRACADTGYPFRPAALGQHKADHRIRTWPFHEYYDEPAIAAVEAAFRWELDFFGYETDGPNRAAG